MSDVTQRPGSISRPPRVREPADAPVTRLNPLLVTLAVLLIAAHAICAGMIVDRALAHASDTIAVNQGD